MSYTFDQLKEDVRKEAEALKIHATKEERERLDIRNMSPNSVTRCYYGLMTGECDSPRATELIRKCTCVFIDGCSNDLANAVVTNTFKEYRWSPIEYYITLPEAKNANLISFLRGETETLEL